MKLFWRKDLVKRSHRIAFFTKRQCSLCDDARDMLHDLGKEFPLVVQEIDIMTDSSLYERYKYTVPVVVVNDEFTLEGRIGEKDLRLYLEGKVKVGKAACE